jgi:RNA-directed DNA polymerase
MMLSFDELFSVSNIEAEYSCLLNSKYDFLKECPRILPGYDRNDLPLFENSKNLHFRAINNKVLLKRSNKTTISYTFSPFLERKVPKPESSKTRTISVSTIRDTIVQRLLKKHIEQEVESRLGTSVYGFRKNCSAHKAVRKVQQHLKNGMVYVFEADIQEFFDKVDHDLLNGMVCTLDIDPRAKTLIHRFLRADRVSPEDVAADKKSGGKLSTYKRTKRTCGVPQGGVLSGMLTNLYLSEFDKKLSSYQGYVRYADDFVVCCSTPEEVESVRCLVTESLNSLKLSLHPIKTSQPTDTPTASLEFLGFSISGVQLSVSKKNLRRYKKRILKVIASNFCYENPEYSFQKLLQRLRYKFCGPTPEQLSRSNFDDKPLMMHRKCWIGFFRNVTDQEQIKQLDRWICGKISHYAWHGIGLRKKRKDIQRGGLPSLVNILYRSRRSRPMQPHGLT